MNASDMLAGKVVVVTGAGQGIGAGIARLAANRGAKVLVNDLGGGTAGGGSDPGPANMVAEEIKAAGGQAIASVRDISNWESAHGVVEDALRAFGRIDVVVNNAAVLRDVIFHKMERADWDIVRSVTLDGYFFVSRAAAPYFKTQESGCFVHMTSTSGLIGNLGQANYAAAKIGVTGLSKSIAIDMARFNVRSNCIAPFAYTRLVGTIPLTTERNRERMEIIKQMKPEKIAPLAVALMSDEAKDISGEVFGARGNELFMFSQSRPVRSAQSAQGWAPETIVSTVLPAMRAGMYGLAKSGEVFSWDPV